MESAAPDLPGRAPDEAAGAGRHLPCRTPREREQQNAIGRGTGLDEVRDAKC